MCFGLIFIQFGFFLCFSLKFCILLQNRTDITQIRTIFGYFMGFKMQYNFEPNPKCYYPNPIHTNKNIRMRPRSVNPKTQKSEISVRTDTRTPMPNPNIYN